MRRRLIQLFVVLIAVGAVIGTPAPAEAGWCVEFYACEPSGRCAFGDDYYRYFLCCDDFNMNCESWRSWAGCC